MRRLGVSVFFCSKKLGLPEFVLFKLSQTHEQSISFLHLQRKGNHIIPLTPKVNFSEKKGANCDFSPTPENIGRNEKIDF